MTAGARRFFGYETVRIERESAVSVLNFMKRCGVIYDGLCQCEDGIVFRVSRRDMAVLSVFLEGKGIVFQSHFRQGLLGKILRYKKRFGLVIGGLLLVLALQFSTGFIWQIKVSGNVDVPPEEIRSLLRELGCDVGSRIDGIDFEKLCNRYIAVSDNISWISVNMRGTVARVEVREQRSPVINEGGGPSNLIAARGGVIERIACYGGDSQVSEGQVVREGELLISGFAADRDENMYLTRSKGEVIARTEREISVFVPYKTVQKVYTGRIFEEKSINIFGKIIKLSKNTGNYSGFYDRIEEEKNWVLFDRIILPVSVQRIGYHEYREEAVIMTEAESIAEAQAQIKSAIAALPRDAEILGISTATEVETDGVRITCLVGCLENIAEERPIEVE